MKYNFSEILADETKLGKKISQGDYLADGQFPIIDQGQKEIAGYSNETDGLFRDVPAIIFGDHTRVLKFVNKPFFLGADGVKLLKQKRNEDNAKYLFYALKNVKIPNTGYNRHFKWLKEAHIEIPKRKQQDAVVKILDSITALISLRQRQAEKLDELVKARFVEMFGDPVLNTKHWEKASLLALGSCKNGMSFHANESGIKLRCLGVGDFKNLSYIDDVEQLPFVSLAEKPSANCFLHDGDIVFVRSNGNKALVGRCLLVYPRDTPTIYSGFCIRYRLLTEKVDPIYALHVLKADGIRQKMSGRGANIQNLNQKILAAIEMPIPPLPLQNAFATFVHEVDREKERIQRSAALLETLKRSLMQQYFG